LRCSAPTASRCQGSRQDRTDNFPDIDITTLDISDALKPASGASRPQRVNSRYTVEMNKQGDTLLHSASKKEAHDQEDVRREGGEERGKRIKSIKSRGGWSGSSRRRRGNVTGRRGTKIERGPRGGKNRRGRSAWRGGDGTGRSV
jgi:hypothetical protein